MNKTVLTTATVFFALATLIFVFIEGAFKWYGGIFFLFIGGILFLYTLRSGSDRTE